MISLSIRRTLCDPQSEVDRVPGISIPDWDEVEGLQLLRSVDYYEDAAFNYHLLGLVLAEVERWRQYEVGRGDPESRMATIDRIHDALSSALESRRYAVFLAL